MARSINTIANEIFTAFEKEYRDAKKKYFETGKGKMPKHPRDKYVHAYPYLEAMLTLDSIEDNYIADSGRSIVIYAIGNLNTWRGEKAREIKKELNQMIK